MSPYERRRGGNAPPGGSRGRPGAGNARPGQRGSGHSVATTVGYAPDTELGYAGPASWRRGEANSTASGRRVRQHRSFARWGKARPEKWRAEPRPEPDSGNPTVRDRRGASGNVASWSSDLHAARAPDFYLDNRMHGSMRRREATTASRASTRRAAEGASRRPYNPPYVKLPAKSAIFGTHKRRPCLAAALRIQLPSGRLDTRSSRCSGLRASHSPRPATEH